MTSSFGAIGFTFLLCNRTEVELVSGENDAFLLCLEPLQWRHMMCLTSCLECLFNNMFSPPSTRISKLSYVALHESNGGFFLQRDVESVMKSRGDWNHNNPVSVSKSKCRLTNKGYTIVDKTIITYSYITNRIFCVDKTTSWYWNDPRRWKWHSKSNIVLHDIMKTVWEEECKTTRQTHLNELFKILIRKMSMKAIYTYLCCQWDNEIMALNA